MSGKGAAQQKRFADKVIVITGASAGIGLGVAEFIAAEGGTIVAVGRREKALQEAAQKLKAAGAKDVEIVAADASTEAGNKKAINTAVQKFGRIDGLYANAGAAPFSPILELDEDTIDTALNTNVKGVIWGIKYAMKAMIDKRTQGSIVVCSSAVAALAKSTMKGAAVYAASKAAVDMIMQYAAIEGAEHGIRVNSVRPGIVATNLFGPDSSGEKMNSFAKDSQLLGRAGRPSEIAPLVGLLLSEEGSFISGSAHLADGLWSVT